jgi:hypothetical protein
MHTTKDMYKFFVQKYPGTDVTYPLYRHVISEFNKAVASRALLGEHIVLGKNMGKILIRKVNRNYEKRVVDFGATRKLKDRGIDKVVYFTNAFYFKWSWDKRSSKAVNKSAYNFKPSGGAGGLRKRLARLLNDDDFSQINFS